METAESSSETEVLSVHDSWKYLVHLQDCIHERQGPGDLSEGGPTPIDLGNLPDVGLYSMEEASCYGFGNHA